MIEMIKSVNCDKKDNVKATITSDVLNDLKQSKITVTGIILFNKVDDESGEVFPVTALKLKDGKFVTSISPTVRTSAEMIADSFKEEIETTGIEIEIKKGTSKGGRTFLILDLV